MSKIESKCKGGKKDKDYNNDKDERGVESKEDTENGSVDVSHSRVRVLMKK